MLAMKGYWSTEGDDDGNNNNNNNNGSDHNGDLHVVMVKASDEKDAEEDSSNASSSIGSAFTAGGGSSGRRRKKGGRDVSFVSAADDDDDGCAGAWQGQQERHLEKCARRRRRQRRRRIKVGKSVKGITGSVASNVKSAASSAYGVTGNVASGVAGATGSLAGNAIDVAGKTASKAKRLVLGRDDMAWERLVEIEKKRREILRRNKVGFFRILLFWDGTVLSALARDPLFYAMMIIYVLVRVAAYAAIPDFVAQLGGAPIGIIGGFLSFFLVLYVDAANKRFETQYEICMDCERKILDTAVVARSYLPRPQALRLIRYMNAVVRELPFSLCFSASQEERLCSWHLYYQRLCSWSNICCCLSFIYSMLRATLVCRIHTHSTFSSKKKTR